MAAAAEQPLKKRKLYEPPPPSSPPPPQPPPPPPQSPATPPPFSPDEINRRRRNQEEIRNVFECYKRIKFYVEQKNNRRFAHELEEAYHSLIAASRGGASVQRLIAEYVPRYASYCPTALETATGVVINIYERCFTEIIQGEDVDSIAFKTANACILGLVDICCAASSEAPTSAVTQHICSAVFLRVFNFFVSSFDGKDVFQIVDERILKIHKVADSFSEFQHEFPQDDNSTLIKLSKICALSFLRILISCPKSSIFSCFELFESPGTEGPRNGTYILRQLTLELNGDVVNQQDEECVGDKLSNEISIDSTRTKSEGKHLVDNCSASSGKSFSHCKTPILKKCLLGLIFGEDLSLKSWIFLKYRTLCNSAPSEIVSDITALLEGVFESFMQQVTAESNQIDGFENISGFSKHGSQYGVSRISGQQGSPSVVSGRDYLNKFSGIHLNNSSPAKVDPIDGGESKTVDSHYAEPGDLSNGRNFMPRELLSRQSFSPKARTPREFRSNSFGGRDCTAQIDKSPVLSADQSVLALRSSSGDANFQFESPKCNTLSPSSSSTNHVTWYVDGDPASMDIFLASKQLWLGSLGPDASEMLIRFQFDKFGYIDHFRYFPSKGFATIEYRNIMDASKAREVMRGRSPWGSCLQVKFLDMALGTRGAINGTAVGSSCHVYVGNVSSKWAKDEMIHEVNKVLHKGPRMAIDLHGEGALLMEFDSPEEAAISIAQLRWHRKETGYFFPPPSTTVSAAPASVMMHVEGERPAPSSIHPDTRNNFSANNMSGLPHAQNVAEKHSDSYLTRTSALSTLLHQLRAKYNITHPHSSVENFTPSAPLREQDRVSAKTLWIKIPNVSPSCITDDDVLAVCNLAINNVGSVVWLSRSNLPMGSCWLVECSSIESANTLSRNLRDCPGTFFQIDFSNSGKHHGPAPPVRPEGSTLELLSPRASQESHGPMQNAHTFQSTWAGGRMLEVGRTGPSEQSWMYGKPESGIYSGPGSTASISMQTQRPSVAPPQPVHVSTFGRPVYASPNNIWDARGLGHHLPTNHVPSGVVPSNAHANLQGPPFLPASVTPLAQIKGSSMVPFDQRFSRPVVLPPLSSLPPPPSNIPPPVPQLDFRPRLPHPGLQPPLPSTPPPLPPPPPHSQPPMLPPPPSSPLPPPHSQPPIFPPPPSSPLPPPPHSQPPIFPPPPSSPLPPPPPPPPPPHSQPPIFPPPPSSPLPLPPPPHSQPPVFPPPLSSPLPPPPHSQHLMFPPPPSSPLPPPPSVSFSTDSSTSRLLQQYPWQGILSKSGVYYCTINAQRVDSDICKYSNALAEPEGWPAKLDMMKRTDLRHVKSTFSSTPPHRREICWLLPSSHDDHKGFQDFITYLKQRECAGVIKIAASRSMWARLLFILPYSPDTCSMLSVPPNPSLCLLGLVLPKETNADLA